MEIQDLPPPIIRNDKDDDLDISEKSDSQAPLMRKPFKMTRSETVETNIDSY